MALRAYLPWHLHSGGTQLQQEFLQNRNHLVHQQTPKHFFVENILKLWQIGWKLFSV